MKSNFFSAHKLTIFKICICGALLVLGLLLRGNILRAVLLSLSYTGCAYGVLYGAICDIKEKEFFSEKALMCIASFGAVVLGKLPEAVAVLLFYTLGELFEDAATESTRKSISSLMALRPEYANLITDSSIVKCPPERVKIGDIVVVYAGEKIPLDGVVIEGSSFVDTSSLTGESIPVAANAGERVFGGSINTTGIIKIKVLKEYGQSTAAEILSLIENAPENRSKAETFTKRFAKHYTPAVCALTLITATVPPLITGNWSLWLNRALTLLVISCPCALVISVPLAFFCALGAASKNGVLIKGSCYLEMLGKIKTFAFDKTGTLTKGEFSVTETVGNESLLTYAAAAQAHSSHPLAKAILKIIPNAPAAYGHKTLSGLGVCCVLGGKKLYAGNAALMEKIGVNYEKSAVGTVVHCAFEDEYLGYIVLGDKPKAEAASVLKKLKSTGAKTVILSGDSEYSCRSVADEVGADEYFGNLMPDGKTRCLKELKKQGFTAFTGDGINDAPVLLCADVGIAMGTLGSDAAIETADAVILDDNLEKIPYAVGLCRRTVNTARLNTVFSVAVKIAVLILGMCGIANIWLAVFADVGVLILAVLNSLRLAK